MYIAKELNRIMKKLIRKLIKCLFSNTIKGWVSTSKELPKISNDESIEVTVYNQSNEARVITKAIYSNGKFYGLNSWLKEERFEFKNTTHWTYSELTPNKLV